MANATVALAALWAGGYSVQIVDGDDLEIVPEDGLSDAHWQALAGIKPELLALLRSCCPHTADGHGCAPDGAICTLCPGKARLLIDQGLGEYATLRCAAHQREYDARRECSACVGVVAERARRPLRPPLPPGKTGVCRQCQSFAWMSREQPGVCASCVSVGATR